MAATLALTCHPRSVSPTPLAIVAQVETLADGGLRFTYALGGASALEIPPPALPQAIDGLWQHTCCEAFVAARGRADYREFNFSPSGCWAAYRFHGYRDRDLDWAPSAAPAIDRGLQAGEDRLLLVATVPASLLPESPQFDISLTAVAEDRQGQKSYWALTHSAAQPDFHCRDSFTLSLNRP